MISPQEMQTICAALRYWEDEMCPHGAEAMQSYLLNTEHAALNAAQIQALRGRLESCDLLHGTVNRNTLHGQTTVLVGVIENQIAEADRRLATVLIPRSPQA